MSDELELKPEKRKSRLLFWLVDSLLAILLIGVWCVTFVVQGTGVSDFEQGYRIGHMLSPTLWLGIISYLLYRFVFKKRKGSGILVFLSLMLAVSVYQYFRAVDKVQAQAALDRMFVTALEDAIQGREIDTTRYSPDQLGRLRPTVALFFTHVKKQNDLYQSIMADLGDCYRDALNPSRLSASEKILESKLKLTRADTLIQTFESQFSLEIEGACQWADSIAPQIGMSKAFAQGFRVGIEKSQKSMAELMVIERRFVCNLDTLFDFLLVRDGSYHFDNTQIILATQADVDRYDLLISRLSELITAEESWRKGRVESAKVKLADLKNRQN
jgi:hypothetical protein